MRHWTIEDRQRQAELIKQWQPWEKSTGARTGKGKNTSKMNAYKHGDYSQKAKEVRRELRKLTKQLHAIYPTLRPVWV